MAKRAFAAVFPKEKFNFIELKSESGVPDQPMDGETRSGALNRLKYIQAKHPDADYWISQEGGLHREGDKLFNRAWIAVSDKIGFVAESSTSHFYLPKKLTDYIKDGMELGHAADKFFGSVNSKQDVGAIGHLTHGVVNRTEWQLQAAIIALAELKHKEWY